MLSSPDLMAIRSVDRVIRQPRFKMLSVGMFLEEANTLRGSPARGHDFSAESEQGPPHGEGASAAPLLVTVYSRTEVAFAGAVGGH